MQPGKSCMEQRKSRMRAFRIDDFGATNRGKRIMKANLRIKTFGQPIARQMYFNYIRSVNHRYNSKRRTPVIQNRVIIFV